MALKEVIPMAVATMVSNDEKKELFQNSNITTDCHPRRDNGYVEELIQQGYTEGLIQSMLKNNKRFPLRVWIVDNSGSTAMNDGHRIVPNGNRGNLKMVNCSRWAEIQNTVKYHAQMAALLDAQTEFRLLNNPGSIVRGGKFSIAERDRSSNFIEEDLLNALNIIESVRPSGVTPLSERVREIRAHVASMSEHLFEFGQKVAIVIATDGLPSNSSGHTLAATKCEFERALRSLVGLPVWIVIRLCTDEDDVVEYYNNLDAELELSLEVLDDFVGEAEEVYEHNKWLNYALPLHRIREMGFHHPLFDLLDERSLTKDELQEFVSLIFGDKLDGVPDLHVDWDGFLKHMSKVNISEQKQWNPKTKKMAYWIDMKKLSRTYSKPSFANNLKRLFC